MVDVSLSLLLVFAAESTAEGTLRQELRPLQFLVGSCWTATFPDGKQIDTHCFESVYRGQFLRDRHVVRGAKSPYEGETLYAWDPKQKKVVYTYWASDGGISTGFVVPAPGEIRFQESYAGAGGGLELETVWKRQGENGYQARVRQRKDGEWREMWTMEFSRGGRRDLPAAQEPPSKP